VDQIEVREVLNLTCQKTDGGFNAVVALPVVRLAWKPKPGSVVIFDVGYFFGNETASAVAVRSYWSNHSLAAGVTADIPHESRIEPNQWGAGHRGMGGPFPRGAGFQPASVDTQGVKLGISPANRRGGCAMRMRFASAAQGMRRLEACATPRRSLR